MAGSTAPCRPKNPRHSAAHRLPRRRARPRGSAHPGRKNSRARHQQRAGLRHRRPRPRPAPATSAFESMYDHSGDSLLHSTGDATFEAVRMLRATDPAQYEPVAGANYPDSPFGKNMKQIAQLLKANLGVEAAFTDLGGWDTHQNQGSVERPARQPPARFFGGAIAAFWRDMGTTPKTSHSSPCRSSAAPPTRTDRRHRSRPRQRHVRPRRQREGRQSLRQMARTRQ